MRYLLLCLLLCSAGCDSDSKKKATSRRNDAGVGDSAADGDGGVPERTISPLLRNGDRLTARVVGAPDGDGVFMHWYDTKLQIPCKFDIADNNTYRCLPFLPGNSPTGHVSSSCDDAPIVINFRPMCSVATHLVREGEKVNETDCHKPRIVNALAMRFNPSEYYDGSPEYCSEARQFPEGGTTAELGMRVPLTEFVKGEYFDVGDERFLGARVMEAEDGARRVIDLRDPDYGLCTFYPRVDNETNCTPRGLAFADGSVHGNDSCTDPLAVTADVTACNPGSIAISIVDFSANRVRHDIRELGDAVADSAKIWFKEGENCRETTVADEIDTRPWLKNLRRPGDKLETQDTDEIVQGPGDVKVAYTGNTNGDRIVPEVYVIKAAAHVRASFSYDGDYCRAMNTTDDKIRCVPALAAEVPLINYADSNCSQPVTRLSPGTLPVGGPGKWAYRPASLDCVTPFPPVEDVFLIDGLHTGDVYTKEGASCQVSGAADEFTYKLGASVLETLPELQVRDLE